MSLKLDDAAIQAVKGRLRALGDEGERVLADIEMKGKRQVFSVGGVGVTLATVVAFGAGALAGAWLF